MGRYTTATGRSAAPTSRLAAVTGCYAAMTGPPLSDGPLRGYDGPLHGWDGPRRGCDADATRSTSQCTPPRGAETQPYATPPFPKPTTTNNILFTNTCGYHQLIQQLSRNNTHILQRRLTVHRPRMTRIREGVRWREGTLHQHLGGRAPGG